MWYRIELNKDRSVSSCVEVEGASTDAGKSVHYVEAQSKAEAISNLAASWKRMQAANKVCRDRQRESRIAAGMCVACGKSPPYRRGTHTCRACVDRRTTRQHARRSGAPLLRLSAAKTVEEQAQRAQACKDRDRQKAARLTAIKPGYSNLTKKASLYREVLAAYRRMGPASFEGWLVSRLIELDSERAEARATARSAVQTPSKTLVAAG